MCFKQSSKGRIIFTRCLCCGANGVVLLGPRPHLALDSQKTTRDITHVFPPPPPPLLLVWLHQLRRPFILGSLQCVIEVLAGVCVELVPARVVMRQNDRFYLEGGFWVPSPTGSLYTDISQCPPACDQSLHGPLPQSVAFPRERHQEPSFLKIFFVLPSGLGCFYCCSHLAF